MCFSLSWLEELLVWLVIVCAIIGVVRLVVPWVASQLGVPIVTQVLNIILWAIVMIFVIYFCFALLACLGDLRMPIMPHR